MLGQQREGVLTVWEALRGRAAPRSRHSCSQKQEQAEEMKKRENHLEKEKADVLLQNKQLKEPLQQAQEQVSELQKKLAHYDKDKEALTVSGQPCPFPSRRGSFWREPLSSDLCRSAGSCLARGPSKVL